MPAYDNAAEWAEAIDAHMRASGQSGADIISHGYANGHILGVPLAYEHSDIEDERGVIVGLPHEETRHGDEWTIRYVQQAGSWEES